VDLTKIIEQLRDEHARLAQAISAIEAVAVRQTKTDPTVKRPRGRPPGSRNKPKLTVVKRPSRPGSTQESSGTEG